MVSTDAGDFVIGLYEGTPEHKNNFIKNINEHVYDSTLVYSVIPNGLMRLGLPSEMDESKYFDKNHDINGVKDEIHPKLIHKNGAVGMLRKPQSENSDNFSDNKLFYLCHGINTDLTTLKTLEAKRNAPLIADYITALLKEESYTKYKDSLDLYKISKMQTEWNNLYLRLTEIVLPRIEKDGKKLFYLSDYQKDIYTHVGGAPIYDGQYVVFGEIVYGIEILEKLSKSKTGLHNQPKENIYILSTQIITKKEFKNLVK
ncbi:MAG: peptidylprolyl isomerase [Bacteroidales bacterium]|nr:peptidylprolyl isomerase [Bacteroidales bacterium]